jgi:hypothetical protein
VRLVFTSVAVHEQCYIKMVCISCVHPLYLVQDLEHPCHFKGVRNKLARMWLLDVPCLFSSLSVCNNSRTTEMLFMKLMLRNSTNVSRHVPILVRIWQEKLLLYMGTYMRFCAHLKINSINRPIHPSEKSYGQKLRRNMNNILYAGNTFSSGHITFHIPLH